MFYIIKRKLIDSVRCGLDITGKPIIGSQAIAVQEQADGLLVIEQHLWLVIDRTLSAHYRCRKHQKRYFYKPIFHAANSIPLQRYNEKLTGKF
jgi:hypothetical protein